MKIEVVSDGSVHEGPTATAVVTSMKNSSPMNRAVSLNDYMPKVKEWSGETTIQTESAEAFLDSLVRLGLVKYVD